MLFRSRDKAVLILSQFKLGPALVPSFANVFLGALADIFLPVECNSSNITHLSKTMTSRLNVWFLLTAVAFGWDRQQFATSLLGYRG